MRFLLVSPASIYSTTDVYDGLLHGLRSLGHEVAPYDFLMYQWHADAFLRQWLPEAGMEDWIPPESELDDDPPPEQAEKYHEYIADMLYQSSKDALCQALDYEVDWVLVVSGLLFSHRVLRMFRQVPSVKVGAICTESPYNDPEQAELIRMCDAAWTNERLSQRRLAESAPGVPVGYLPMAYHPLKHRPRKRAKKLDVVFVGVGYPERIALLEGANWDGIELGLYGDWQFVEPHSPLRPYVKQGIIENEEAIELYQQSRLGLNLYRSCVDYWRGSGGEAPEGESCNPRAYELAACGICQVTQARAEAAELFGDAYVGFTDSSELEMLVRTLLEDGGHRQSLARQQRRAVSGHSYTDRARAIVDGLTV